jgi:FG-GAP-like repeat
MPARFWLSSVSLVKGFALMIKHLAVIPLLMVAIASPAAASDFEPPIMMKAAGKAIRVESPGYAAPCWADVDKDGHKDLLVGQFNDGKIHVYRNLGDGEFAERTWLEADGQTATVPGVW